MAVDTSRLEQDVDKLIDLVVSLRKDISDAQAAQQSASQPDTATQDHLNTMADRIEKVLNPSSSSAPIGSAPPDMGTSNPGPSGSPTEPPDTETPVETATMTGVPLGADMSSTGAATDGVEATGTGNTNSAALPGGVTDNTSGATGPQSPQPLATDEPKT